MARRSKNRKRLRTSLTAEEIRLVEASVRRNAAIEGGFYDGRNAPKTFVDRKRHASKNACRGRVQE